MINNNTMKKFNKLEEEKILAAIQDLENSTSGEFVPCISKISDSYEEGSWYLTAMSAFAVFLILMIGSYFWMIPPNLTFFQVGLFSSLFLLFMLILGSFFSSIRLLFVSDSKKTERAMAEAERIFLDEEIFKTINRTGILLYISVKERKVVILGDSGINKQVMQEDWNEMVEIILKGIKKKQLPDAIVNAIGKAKHLLLENDFPKGDSPKNELSDRIRYRL